MMSDAIIGANVCPVCGGASLGSVVCCGETSMSGGEHVHYSSYKEACEAARRERLNEGLRNLSKWCERRSFGDHDTLTTQSMLSRKVVDLEKAVDKAGWLAVEKFMEGLK